MVDNFFYLVKSVWSTTLGAPPLFNLLRKRIYLSKKLKNGTFNGYNLSPTQKIFQELNYVQTNEYSVKK